MSGEDEAREAVQAALREHHTAVRQAAQDMAVAVARATHEGDLVEAFAYTADVLLAAEHLRKTAAAAEQAMRATLAAQMTETGCFRADNGELSVYLAKRRARMEIDNPGMIPDVFYFQPPPELDKQRMLQVLEAGGPVPGAHLVRPNDFVVNVRVKQKP